MTESSQVCAFHSKARTVRERSASARIGVRLLHRNTRGVQLTEAGRLYHQSALEILDHVQRLEDRMESARTGPGGRLRVSSSVALARRRLVPALGAFTRAHAGLCVELLGSDRYVDFFKEPLDVALRMGRLAGVVGVGR